MSDLATAARKATEWTRKRDALIREAHASGSSLRAIASLAGLSHTQVSNIVKKVAD